MVIYLPEFLLCGDLSRVWSTASIIETYGYTLLVCKAIFEYDTMLLAN